MTTLLSRLRARKGSSAPDPLTSDEESRYRPIEWSLIRKLLRTLAPYKWQYALGISVAWTHVMMDLMGPQFVGTIVNFIGDILGETARGQSSGFVEWGFKKFTGPIVPADLSVTQAIGYLSVIIAIWALTVALSVILQRWAILIMVRTGENVQFFFRRALFEHLQKLDMSFYDKTKLGRIISRCTSDIGGMREVNVWGIAHIVIQGSSMLIASAMLWYTDWRLFVSVVWLGPVLFLVNRYFIKRSAVRWQVVREGFTRVSTNLAENINGMRVVTAFNRQDPNLAVFNRLQVNNTTNNLSAARLNGTYQPTLEVIRYVGRGIILVYGGYLIASGQMQDRGVGAVVQAYLYWDWFMNPILVLGNFYNQLMMAMAGAERVFALLETQPRVTDTPDAKPLPRIQGFVRFENVTFGYDPDRPVLHDIDFEARPGQMFALVGHTGSGKSSIISLIARFYQPQKGRILIDGHDIRYVTGESLHRQMGLVLQVNYLFSGTVLDNIRYARPQATEAQVIEAAKQLGTWDAIASLKNGLETDVGERGANMSLGQRQLICFTRAYLADPRIFMLDEATSAVDTGTEQLIQRSLERLLQGRTTFVVAHRLSTILRSDCILVMDQGRLIERGTHAELISRGGKYAHLYHQFAHSTAD
ncbi:MAG: putative ABC transporter ATP-binding protein YknV [Phycisphaerae bacterium]|nr:MAG: putative ABC transporter ATP-binding protein YknV [Phycisphaerae bacterium]